MIVVHPVVSFPRRPNRWGLLLLQRERAPKKVTKSSPTRKRGFPWPSDAPSEDSPLEYFTSVSLHTDDIWREVMMMMKEVAPQQHFSLLFTSPVTWLEISSVRETTAKQHRHVYEPHKMSADS